jgi:hypothetical protein
MGVFSRILPALPVYHGKLKSMCEEVYSEFEWHILGRVCAVKFIYKLRRIYTDVHLEIEELMLGSLLFN